ncbi:MAG: hypothetical protein ACI8PZ_000612 [Myxococcota bacterium]|jgi:hypothetical protein
MSRKAELIMMGVGLVTMCSVTVIALFGMTTVAVGVTVLRHVTPDEAPRVQVAQVVQPVAAPPTVAATPAAPPPAASPVVPEAASPAAPVRRAPRRRAARAPVRSPVRAASVGSVGGGADDVLAMSISQLRGMLGGASVPVPPPPTASPVVPPRAPVAPPPAPVARIATAPRAPVARPPVAAAVAQPERIAAPPRRIAAPPPPVRRGDALVVDGGLPLLDPVRVTVGGSGLRLEVDGEAVGPVPAVMLVEAGSHDLVIVGDGTRASFRVNASNGDAWCYAQRGNDIKAARCR